MKTYIPAGMASSAPPLGTMLGQVKQRKLSLLHAYIDGQYRKLFWFF